MVISLKPFPAPRPRFSRFGTYNPKNYTEYKKMFLLLAKASSKEHFKGAISLEVVFYMPIPASLSKKKQSELIGKHHIKKPDADNLLKTVKDALEGTFYKNDSQICDIQMKKIYSDKPRTVLHFKEIY